MNDSRRSFALPTMGKSAHEHAGGIGTAHLAAKGARPDHGAAVGRAPTPAQHFDKTPATYGLAATGDARGRERAFFRGAQDVRTNGALGTRRPLGFKVPHGDAHFDNGFAHFLAVA
jgi:hypothetical protein